MTMQTCLQATLIMFCYLQIRTSLSEDSLEPVSSQLLPSNCKVLLLADVDGDGSLKLITGHADRVVHVHKLQADQSTEGGVQEKLLTGTFGMGQLVYSKQQTANVRFKLRISQNRK